MKALSIVKMVTFTLVLKASKDLISEHEWDKHQKRGTEPHFPVARASAPSICASFCQMALGGIPAPREQCSAVPYMFQGPALKSPA